MSGGTRIYGRKVIYTIGHAEAYARCFAEQECPQKKGRDLSGNDPRFPDGYCGGSVWQTYDDAQKHAQLGYAVYGVMADWETQTAPSMKNGDWHDLLVDADLVMLTPDGERLRNG